MERRNNYDVTNRVDTTDPAAVNGEINRIFVKLYPKASTRVLNRSFRDLVRLHLGEYPGYRASDTGYHNLQHTLDVTLAMARLMDGYERSRDGTDALGPRLFGFGIVTALFHDVGYYAAQERRGIHAQACDSRGQVSRAVPQQAGFGKTRSRGRASHPLYRL